MNTHKKTTAKSQLTKTKITAADAIKQATERTKVSPLSAEGLKELRIILAHNDSATSAARRVGWQRAVQVLSSHGWDGRTIKALDKVCREQLGRTSYTWA